MSPSTRDSCASVEARPGPSSSVARRRAGAGAIGGTTMSVTGDPFELGTPDAARPLKRSGVARHAADKRRVMRRLDVADALPEIGGRDARIGREIAALGPSSASSPGLQHVAIVGDLQRGARVLLDQQDRDAGRAQLRDDAKISRTISGARPRDGSSSISSAAVPSARGRAPASAARRPTASRRAACAARASRGKRAKTSSSVACQSRSPLATAREARRAAGCPRRSSSRTARASRAPGTSPRATRSSTRCCARSSPA